MKYRKILENYVYGNKDTMKEQLVLAIKHILEENNNYKAAALKNDDLYKEVCNKNKELEEEKARYEHKYEIAFNKLIEYEKTLEKLQKETIWKSLIKEKIEELNKMLKKSHKKPQRLTVGEIMMIKTVLQELLRRGEKRCVSIVKKKNALKRYKKIIFIYKYTENI